MVAQKSWVECDPNTPFSLANIPFSIISTADKPSPRPAVAIGDYALDLSVFAENNGFSALPAVSQHLDVFTRPVLNDFAALGRGIHADVRTYLQSILSDTTPNPDLLKTNESLKFQALIPLKNVKTHLAFAIGDYTDFYAGRNHAYNVGCLFRGPAAALQPNYNHLPVAYHGRASSVVVSGTPIRRPWGQTLPAGEKLPVLAPSAKLDLELELAAFVCGENDIGSPVLVDEAERRVFGYALMIDWSARDVQAWEYVPLGPFTSKNLGTSVSPWIVLADALEPFMTEGLKNETELLPYLKETKKANVLDVRFEVDLTTSQGNTTTISRTNSKNLLWSWPQMIAHHTITGCNLRSGDLLGSGTISGTEPGSEGSLLEMTEGGKTPMKLSGGEERRFLEDGDTLLIRGGAGEVGALVGFGEVYGRIEAALPLFGK